MTPPTDSFRLDVRYTRIGDTAFALRRLLRRRMTVIGFILAAMVGYVFVTSRFGGFGLALICAGVFISLSVWAGSGLGLPLFPMVAVQHFFLYALPILVSEATIRRYPESYVTEACAEVLIFLGTMTVGWRVGMAAFHPAAGYCYGFDEFSKGGSAKLTRLGFGLTVVATAYVPLQRLGLLDAILNVMPSGMYPAIQAFISAVAMCGSFMISLMIGSGKMNPTARFAFWVLVAFNCYIFASGFLLSAAGALVITVAAGLFWSSGKVPWNFLVIAGLILAFLNLGKIEMRNRYWTVNGASEIPDFTLGEMPGHYAEWISVSYDILTGHPIPGSARNLREGQRSGPDEASPGGQNLLDRINNLQNLLYVINAEKDGHIPPLGGATYTLIPPLLIPRILYPGEKPRSHEGQVLLNVHFGRQDLESTFSTYVAWGLLPEAYGNFGPFVGSIALGIFFGVVMAWAENYTANKLVISLEGLCAFAIFVGLGNSYEMVASVLVTSIFQSIVPIVVAMSPFVRRRRVENARQEAS